MMDAAIKDAVTSKRADQHPGAVVMATHKVTFLPLNVTVEVDDAKYPLADHGRPGSLLDIALANDIHLEHNCGGSCACTTCHVIVREGEQNLSHHGAGRGGPPRHRGGADAPLAARLSGDRPGRRGRGDPEVGRAAAEVEASEHGESIVKWQDAEDIALALMEAHPDMDPLTVRFTDLHKWVVGAAGLHATTPRAPTRGSWRRSR